MSNFLNVPNLKVPETVNAQGQNQPTGSATGNPRNKIALKPGRSLMDWVRLGSSGKDLTGTGGRRIGVTPSELAKHNTENDAWMCIRGNVYNVTPYMEFHPGGIDELMRGAGRDGTQLFDDVHKWVNYESMLAKCLLGPLVSDEGSQRQQKKKVVSANKPSTSSSLMPPPSAPPPKPAGKTPPRFEWFQTDATVNIVFYPKWKQMKHEFVVIEKLDDGRLKIILLIEDHTFITVLKLDGAVKSDYDVNVSKLTGKVTVDLQKEIAQQKWSALKEDESEPSTFIKTSEVSTTYRECKVASVQQVTHDTKLYRVDMPAGTRMCVPTGHHVQIEESVLGMKISRNYTVVTESLENMNPLEKQGKCLYLLIKIYPEGALTPMLGLLKPNDTIHVSTVPQGTFDCNILDDVDNLTLFAAGTGFTPMVRLIHHALICDVKPQRKIKLIFFNKEVKDILWNDQLDQIQSKHANFEVHDVLSQPHSGWAGSTGRIRKEFINEFVPKASAESKCYFCACGPTPFTEECMKLVKEYGYSENMIHAFLG